MFAPVTTSIDTNNVKGRGTVSATDDSGTDNISTNLPPRRAKRQKLDARCHEINDVVLRADDDNSNNSEDNKYAENIKQAAREEKEFSLDAIMAQTMNDDQKNAYRGIIELCVRIIVFLISINCVFLPGSLFVISINILHVVYPSTTATLTST